MIYNANYNYCHDPQKLIITLVWNFTMIIKHDNGHKSTKNLNITIISKY